MWTPRSVSVQNKDFIVHLKYGAHKSTLKLNKDSTIDQLKQKISQELNIPERNLSLMINGKPCPTQGNITFTQARIPNNCKVLVSVSKVDSEHIYASSSDRVPGQAESSRGGSDTIEVQLDNIKAKALEISQTVNSLEDKNGHFNNYRRRGQGSVQEVKGYKKTAGIQGELLMQSLEKLDRLDLAPGPGMDQQKRKRKEVATLLNSVLDRNDQVMAAFSQHLKSLES
jgi:hypothetical protein